MNSAMRLAGFALICLPGCAAPVAEFPGMMRDVPGKDPVVRTRLQEARDEMAKDRPLAAMRVVEELLRADPGLVNAHRLRQDLLRQRGRLGLALYEAERRLEAEPRSAAARYLLGRLEETTEQKRRAFDQAIGFDPGNFWGWYGLAYTLQTTDPDRANRIYSGLYAQSEHDPYIGTALAESLRRNRRAADALRVFDQIRREHQGLGAAGMADVLLRSDKRAQAWPRLLDALRERPFDGVVQGSVARVVSAGLAVDAIEELLDELRTVPERMSAFNRTAPGVLSEMLRLAGDPDAAIAVLQQAPQLAAGQRRALRRLLIQSGRIDAFLADVAAQAVGDLLDDESNRVRDRWRALLSGPWMTAPDPLASPGQAAELVRALLAVGYLRYADQVASAALLRHPSGASDAAGPGLLVELQDELRKEIAFESALRRRITRGYAAFAKDKQAPSLQAVLEDLRKASMRIFGRDVVGEPRLFELPFVGTLVDSLGPGLPAHLAKYNKHLVLGRRNSRPVEGMILTRIAVRPVDPTAAVPLPPRTVEVVGEHRQLQPLDQGDLAGIALLNHYVVDMDEVRSWAAAIARRRRIAREDGEVLLQDPLPRHVEPMAPAGVDWRLALLSPVEDSRLEAAVLDIIRWHERGHMVDFLHFLPVGLHPLRALALTLRNGLSALSVASEMEARAELVALAVSPHTRLVAAHIAGFLGGDSGDSPHARGFRGLVEELSDELGRRGVERPEVRYWHSVDPHLLRKAAEHLLRRLW